MYTPDDYRGLAHMFDTERKFYACTTETRRMLNQIVLDLHHIAVTAPRDLYFTGLSEALAEYPLDDRLLRTIGGRDPDGSS